MDGKETRGNCDEVVTDNEIIKAYERCFTLGFDESTCYECPFYTATAKCTEDLRDSALALIKRQKTENERLLQKLQQAKSEAIKEFVERLKIKVKMYNSEDVDEGDLIDDFLTVGETVEIIDRLVKEMKRGCK